MLKKAKMLTILLILINVFNILKLGCGSRTFYYRGERDFVDQIENDAGNVSQNSNHTKIVLIRLTFFIEK